MTESDRHMSARDTDRSPTWLARVTTEPRLLQWAVLGNGIAKPGGVEPGRDEVQYYRVPKTSLRHVGGILRSTLQDGRNRILNSEAQLTGRLWRSTFRVESLLAQEESRAQG